jgi:hypothetical protein
MPIKVWESCTNLCVGTEKGLEYIPVLACELQNREVSNMSNVQEVQIPVTSAL